MATVHHELRFGGAPVLFDGVPLTVAVEEDVPGAPTALTVTAYDGSAVASWTAPVWTTLAISGYVIKAVSGGITRTYLSTGTGTQVTLKRLTNGRAWTISVRAQAGSLLGAEATHAPVTPLLGTPFPGPDLYPDEDLYPGAGDVALGEVLQPQPSVPDPPISLAYTAGFQSVYLTWAPPAFDGLSPILRYVVTQTSTTGSVPTETPNQFLTLTGLDNGTSYAVTVTAVNALGASIASDSIVVTPSADSNPLPETPGPTGPPKTPRPQPVFEAFPQFRSFRPANFLKTEAEVPDGQ